MTPRTRRTRKNVGPHVRTTPSKSIAIATVSAGLFTGDIGSLSTAQGKRMNNKHDHQLPEKHSQGQQSSVLSSIRANESGKISELYQHSANPYESQSVGISTELKRMDDQSMIFEEKESEISSIEKNQSHLHPQFSQKSGNPDQSSTGAETVLHKVNEDSKLQLHSEIPRHEESSQHKSAKQHYGELVQQLDNVSIVSDPNGVLHGNLEVAALDERALLDVLSSIVSQIQSPQLLEKFKDQLRKRDEKLAAAAIGQKRKEERDEQREWEKKRKQELRDYREMKQFWHHNDHILRRADFRDGAAALGFKSSAKLAADISNTLSNTLTSSLAPLGVNDVNPVVDGLTMPELHEWIVDAVLGEEESLEYTKRRAEEFGRLLKEFVRQWREEYRRDSVEYKFSDKFTSLAAKCGDEKIVRIENTLAPINRVITAHLELSKMEFEACLSRLPEAARPAFLSIMCSRFDRLVSNGESLMSSNPRNGGSSGRNSPNGNINENIINENISENTAPDHSDDAKFVASVEQEYLARVEKIAQEKLQMSVEDLRDFTLGDSYADYGVGIYDEDVADRLLPIMRTPELQSVLLNAKNQWTLLVKSYVHMKLQDAPTVLLDTRRTQEKNTSPRDNGDMHLFEMGEIHRQHREEEWELLFGEYKSLREKWDKSCRGAQSNLDSYLEGTSEYGEREVYRSDVRRSVFRTLNRTSDPRCPALEKLAGKMHMVLPHDTTLTSEMMSLLADGYMQRTLIDAFLRKSQQEGLGQFTSGAAGPENFVGQCLHQLLQFAGSIPYWPEK